MARRRTSVPGNASLPDPLSPRRGEGERRQLRGFGPLGILAILAILVGNLLFIPLSALLVLLWARLSETPWRAIGFARPRSWIATVAIGLALGVALKLVMKALVMPLLGAPAINPAYQYLVGNMMALPAVLLLVIVGAGFGEETVFRGFLFERLRRLLGSSGQATAAILIVTAVLFGLVHYPEQGLAGAEQGTIMGLVFGVMYLLTGNLWMPMIAHAAFDITAVAIIYWNLEEKFAHLLFP
jgi:membrane protease YdiL (CAAX protease family)